MHPGILWPQGMQSSRAECAGEPCSFDMYGSSEGIDIRFNGYIEGSDSDTHIQAVFVFEKETLFGQSLLGTWVLC